MHDWATQVHDVRVIRLALQAPLPTEPIIRRPTHDLPYNLGLYLAIPTPALNKWVSLLFTSLCINSRYVVYL